MKTSLAAPSSPSPLARERVAGVERRSDATLLALLFLLAVVPYLNTLWNGFVYDDLFQVVDNPYVRSFRHLREIFGTTVWSFQGAQGVSNYYRPLMTFGYLICYQLFGLLAYGFHLANVLLNAGVVWMLFVVTRRVFADRAIAFTAAALFAIHPIHSESVAWVAAVTELELAFLYLLAFWFFLRLGEPDQERAWLWQAGLCGSFALALLSKEQAATLPLLATVYEHFYRQHRAETPWRRRLSNYAGLWVLVAGYLLFRWRFLGGLVPVLQRPDLSWHDAALSAIALLGQYAGKLLWPAQLCAAYAFHKSSSLSDPRVLGGITALLAMAALFVLLWRRERRATVGLLWLVVTLLPVLNARWMPGNAFAERYLYLPSVGFCWLVAWGAVRLWDLASPGRVYLRPALAVVAALLLTLAVARIVTRNRDWRNELVLYTRTLEVEPGVYSMRNSLGAYYWNHGDEKAAEREWRQAWLDGPNQVVTLNNLGLLYSKQKRYAEAIAYFRRALQLKPEFAVAHMNLGSTYEAMGRPEQAETEYRAAVADSPLSYEARNRLGKFYLEAGRLAEAEEQLRRSVEALPNTPGFDLLANVYLRAGKYELAEQAFQNAVALNPYDHHAHFELGAIYAASGRRAEAIREYEAGLLTDPRNAEALAALARLRQAAPRPQ